MAFAEVRFPTDIAYGSVGGPEYFTDIIITHGGYEQRNINWSQARARYNVAHGVKSQDQLSALIAFFRARKGKAVGFRYKDWLDYQAVNENLGMGDGILTAFQLRKAYVSGADTEFRIISKPVSGTVNIYLDSVIQSSSTYMINTTSGQVNFNVAPPHSVLVTADFEFDVPVRFDTDRLSASLDDYGAHSWNNIPLVEVRI